MSRGNTYELRNPRQADLSAYLQQASRKYTGKDTLTVAVTGQVSAYQLALGPTVASNVTLDFTGAYVSSARTGGADDATNCLFSVQGTYNTSKLDTTLTATVYPGDSTLPVTSIGSIAAGDFVEVGCTDNTGTDGYGESGPTGPRAEIVQVLSAASTTITLKGHLRYIHASNSTGQYVRAITPVQRLRIVGGEFYGGSVATGFYLKGVQEVEFDGCRFEGFSRAAVDIGRGSRQVTMRNIRHLGGNNAIAIATTVVDLRAENWSYDPDGDYVHASGYVRNLLCTRQRCVGVRVSDCDFGRAAGGVQFSGSHDVVMTNCTFTDMTGVPKVGRTAEGVATNHFGVAIDMGPQVIANSEFGRNVDITGIMIQDCVTPDDTHAIYLHDVANIRMRGVGMISDSRRAGGGQPLRYGILMSDCLGGVFLRDLQFQGVGRILEIENDGTTAFYDIDGLTDNGAAYDGQLATNDFAFKFQAIAGGSQVFKVRNAKFGNRPYIWWMAPEGGTTNLVKLPLENYRTDGYPCPVAYAESCTVKTGHHPRALGELVEVDASVTGYREVKTATAGTDSRLLAINVSNVDTEAPYAMIAPVNSLGFVKCTTAVVNVGDVLVHDTANVGLAKQDNAATSGRIGRATTYKAAGATGLVQIEPIVI